MQLITANPATNIYIGLIAIAVLILSAEWVIRRTIMIAEHLGISKLFIGLTVISIGTSLPEIFTHIVASVDMVRGTLDPYIASGAALGTNIGSDIIQQNMIVGIVALFGVLFASHAFMKRDFKIMILAAVVLFFFSVNGFISRLEGILLIVFYLAYLWRLMKTEKKHMQNNKNHKNNHLLSRGRFVLGLVEVFIGLVFVIFSAELILRIATFFVLRYNVSSSMIGVLTIGIATALPELTTAIVSIMKKSSSIALGTLIGSNITNPTFALGIGAAISGYHVPGSLIWYDLPVKIATALLLYLFLWRDRKLSKVHALVMIGLYVTYIFIRMQYFNVDF